MKSPKLSLAIPALGAVLCVVSSACSTAQPVRATTSPDAQQTPWAHPNAQVVAPNQVMYARNGSVVGAPEPGSVVVDSAQTKRDVGQDGGSRMYLLERFQETVEENESLQFEVQGLAAALDQAEARAAQFEADLNALQAKFMELNEQKKQLEDDNLELAEHLTTAQIRRLQAEKLLIEAKIDWQRVQRMTESDLNPGLRAEADESMPKPASAPQEANE